MRTNIYQYLLGYLYRHYLRHPLPLLRGLSNRLPRNPRLGPRSIRPCLPWNRYWRGPHHCLRAPHSPLDQHARPRPRDRQATTRSRSFIRLYLRHDHPNRRTLVCLDLFPSFDPLDRTPAGGYSIRRWKHRRLHLRFQLPDAQLRYVCCFCAGW